MRAPKQTLLGKLKTMSVRCIAFVLMLSVFFCVQGAAAEAVGMLSQLEKEQSEAAAQRFLDEAMDWAMEYAALEEKSMQVGDWLIHPKGFSFRVPKELEVNGRYKGTDIVLVDKTENSSSFRTNIAALVSKKDDAIYDLTEQKTISAYNSQFSRFKLRGFAIETLFGVECVRISFVYNESPQLFAQQYLFTKYDQTYYITLTTENTLRSISRGLRLLSEVSESMLFGETTNLSGR